MGYNESVMYPGLRFTAEQSKDMMSFANLVIDDAIKGVDRESLPYIHTFYGIKFRHAWPLAEDVCIEDIAHSLSRICRFAGHIRDFYSVAQHSVLVSYICDTKDALDGLLHDGSEAYCVDVPRPLKRSPGMEVYRVYEGRTAKVIQERFNLGEEPDSVKVADLRLLATEKRDLFWRDSSWAVNKGEYGEPLSETIVPWTPEESERRFLMRYNELTGENRFYEKYYEEG